MTNRYLIVNADDFGQSLGVNRGIIQAHERGIVTSTSMMVRWPAAAEAAAYGREHPKLGVGLHFDVAEWRYRDGNWDPVYQVVSVQDPAAVKQELLRQLAVFHALMGMDPTHIDSHQHVHLREPAHSVVAEVVKTLGVPLRNCDPRIPYCGAFYGQTGEGDPYPEGLSFENLARTFRGLPPGFTELGCHPSMEEDLDTMYSAERKQEVAMLCDPRVRAVLAELDIKLCSFRDAADVLAGASA